MKKFLTILFAFIMCFSLSSCAEKDERGRRVCYIGEDITFVEVYSFSGNAQKQPFVVFVHKETRVMYISSLVSGDKDGGISVMLDENGKPLLWEGEL